MAAEADRQPHYRHPDHTGDEVPLIIDPVREKILTQFWGPIATALVGTSLLMGPTFAWTQFKVGNTGGAVGVLLLAVWVIITCVILLVRGKPPVFVSAGSALSQAQEEASLLRGKNKEIDSEVVKLRERSKRKSEVIERADSREERLSKEIESKGRQVRTLQQQAKDVEACHNVQRLEFQRLALEPSPLDGGNPVDESALKEYITGLKDVLLRASFVPENPPTSRGTSNPHHRATPAL